MAKTIDLDQAAMAAPPPVPRAAGEGEAMRIARERVTRPRSGLRKAEPRHTPLLIRTTAAERQAIGRFAAEAEQTLSEYVLTCIYAVNGHREELP
jgi:hypothetical protein